GGGDETDDLDAPDHLVQADQRVDRPEQVERATLGQPLGLLGGDRVAALAGRQQLAVDEWQLAGYVHVLAGFDGRHVRGDRRDHGRYVIAELGEPGNGVRT